MSMIKIFIDNQVHFYDQRNYNYFIYELSQGRFNGLPTNDYSSSEATFVIDFGAISENIKKWKSCLPKVQLNYNARANCDSRLIRVLKGYFNLKFTVSSRHEITELVEKIDVDPTSLIFDNLYKYTGHIQAASDYGVEYLSASTAHEVERIHHIYPNAKLLLHYSMMNQRFYRMLIRCIQLKVTIVGLYYDLPECKSKKNIDYAHHFNNLRAIINFISTLLKIQIRFVNLGSNIPLYSSFDSINGNSDNVISDDDKSTVDVDNKSAATTINRKSQFQEFARYANKFTQENENIKVIAEPTSFIFDNTNKLCCNVMGIRQLFNEEREKIMFYYLNDGIYGSLSNIYFRGYSPIVDVIEKETLANIERFGEDAVVNVEKCATTFWGPTCDSMDKINIAKSFPVMSLGDTVVFKDVGLYNLVCGTTFNGFRIPATRFIVSYQQLMSLGVLVGPEHPNAGEIFWNDGAHLNKE